MLASSDVLAGGRPGAILVSTACAGGADGDLLRTIKEGFAEFFKQADLAHKWLGHAPVYRVQIAAIAPRDE